MLSGSNIDETTWYRNCEEIKPKMLFEHDHSLRATRGGTGIEIEQIYNFGKVLNKTVKRL